MRVEDCTCPQSVRRRYLGRISRPLLDRIDVRLEIQPPPASAILTDVFETEDSATVAARVLLARQAARERWAGAGQAWSRNADVPGPILRSTQWRLASEVTNELDSWLRKDRISARGYDRILKLAWTLADLHGHNTPDADDIAGACRFRLGSALA